MRSSTAWLSSAAVASADPAFDSCPSRAMGMPLLGRALTAPARTCKFKLLLLTSLALHGLLYLHGSFNQACPM